MSCRVLRVLGAHLFSCCIRKSAVEPGCNMGLYDRAAWRVRVVPALVAVSPAALYAEAGLVLYAPRAKREVATEAPAGVGVTEVAPMPGNTNR